MPAASPAFLAALTPVYEKYFELSAALSGDDLEAARAAFAGMHPPLDAVAAQLLLSQFIDSRGR